VEGCLFRISREPLEAESTVFRDMFLLPQGESGTVEGQNDTCPVVLRGVSKKEFESLLRALIQHGTNRGLDLDYDQRVSVLKLSTMWEFTGLRNAAIRYLDHPLRPLDPISKAELALQYNIEKWLLPALLVLARRSAPISIEEGRRIGFEDALKLASVEDSLFRISREPLEAESTVFRDMFLLPRGESETVEGQSDTCHVILQGISKKEFESLLRALMHRKHGTNRGLDLDCDQWISVLKLSAMWEFVGLRNAAIQHLDIPSELVDPIDKVVLALQYNIREWLLPAFLALAKRPTPISIEEGRRIGFENALKLASVREKLRLVMVVEEFTFTYKSCTRTQQYNTRRLVLGDRDKEAENLDYTPFIREVFGL
ncbi:hypothetical protein F5J12DRAFT_725567, partial [Pisolithus orientalis]|uniref:uncharacterized protein n=1 Tax=Pisolithus orientalis TaxID=936130 RepID=UPI002224BE2B